LGKSLPFSGKISLRHGAGLTLGVLEGEGMGVGRSVGNSVLVGDVVMDGSSNAVAEGTSVLDGASVPAGTAVSGVLAGPQPETSTAKATRSAETVNNRRRASKLTFLGFSIYPKIRKDSLFYI
jgi:hypothetical protein